MAAVSYRGRQLLVSLIGALILLPLDFFMGGLFSFSFGAQNSLWAWAFGLTAFWGQIICILTSFFRPRVAAVWMLLNVAASSSILLGCEMARNSGHGLASLSKYSWLEYAPGLAQAAAFFWIAPMIFALLLLRPDVSLRHHEQAVPLAKM